MPVIDAELEGEITEPRPALDGTNAVLTVVGVSVLIPAAVAVNTPTKAITVAQFVDLQKLPGRAQQGFLGGTAIVEGTFDTDTGVLTAASVEVEPAENLLSGALTSFNPPAVNGVPVAMLPVNEPRMPGLPPINEFGFPAVLNAKVLNTLATAEGYFDGATFRAHLLELDGGADLVKDVPQVSITRARFRELGPPDEEGDRFDIRGAVTLMHTGATQQSVQIYRVDNGVPRPLGQPVIATQDADFPRFATWRFNDETALTANPALGISPQKIRAENRSPGAMLAFFETDTEVRV